MGEGWVIANTGTRCSPTPVPRSQTEKRMIPSGSASGSGRLETAVPDETRSLLARRPETQPRRLDHADVFDPAIQRQFDFSIVTRSLLP